MRCPIILLLVFSIASIASAQDDEITLTTYYPAPYGDYSKIAADSMSIGDSSKIPAAPGVLHLEPRSSTPGTANKGDLYYSDGTDATEGLYVQDATGWVRGFVGGAGAIVEDDELEDPNIGTVYPAGSQTFTIPVEVSLAQRSVIIISALFGFSASGGAGALRGTITIDGVVHATNAPQSGRPFLDSVDCFAVLDAGDHDIVLIVSGGLDARAIHDNWTLTDCVLRYAVIA